ncbi:MAG TPA: TfuA-like protein [Candidatus Dormibacteraeota bacterium]
MRVVIFTGPTLTADEGRTVLDADYLPPAGQGDVYRAALRNPQVIGIIDGYFERVPSVWHKEILWSMSRGIHVFGSASMGALRAAELAAFGMEGVGSIFEAYRDGVLEDDDEVAVVHGSDEFEFRAGSDALVDIRSTIARAVEAGVLSATTGVAIECVAKDMFYPQRNYHAIARHAVETGLPPVEVSALLEWLPGHRFSQKRADALAMLETIRQRVESGFEPKQVKYSFESSSMWEQAWRLAGEQYASPAGGTATIDLDMVLDELRLEGERYLHAEEAAILRCLSIKQSYVQGLPEAATRVSRTAPGFWGRLGIADADARDEWMRVNNLDAHQLTALLEDEARVQWIRTLAGFEAAAYLFDHLRVTGDFPRLMGRAATKRSLLESSGLSDPTLADAGLDWDRLLRWYFEERLGRGVPADVDRYSKDLGFEGKDAFQASVVREYCFLQRVPIAR